MSALERATNKRWDELWRRLALWHKAPISFETVASKYGQIHRHYHTLKHIDHCLAELDTLRDDDSGYLELALWMHDYEYDPRQRNNEFKSAEAAVELARKAEMSKEEINLVFSCILDTSHENTPHSNGGRIVVDIDLSILGSDWETFLEYERDIRAEYSFVPVDVYCKKRSEFLRKMLERKSIFSTIRFATMYERIAMENIAHSLEVLESGRLH